MLDGGPINTSISDCSNTTLTSLGNSAHSITVYVNDTSGNQNSSTVDFTVTSGGGGNGGDPPECNSDSDCEECYYCSIATETCKLKADTQCLMDSDCSYFGGGYACNSCNCTPPECSTNFDCPDDEYCLDYNCTDVECDCGYVENHQCHHYECCDDSDCPSDQECESHECIIPSGEEPGTGPEAPEITPPIAEPPFLDPEEISKEVIPLVGGEDGSVGQGGTWEIETVFSKLCSVPVAILLLPLLLLLFFLLFKKKKKKKEEKLPKGKK